LNRPFSNYQPHQLVQNNFLELSIHESSVDIPLKDYNGIEDKTAIFFLSYEFISKVLKSSPAATKLFSDNCAFS